MTAYSEGPTPRLLSSSGTPLIPGTIRAARTGRTDAGVEFELEKSVRFEDENNKIKIKTEGRQASGKKVGVGDLKSGLQKKKKLKKLKNRKESFTQKRGDEQYCRVSGKDSGLAA